MPVFKAGIFCLIFSCIYSGYLTQTLKFNRYTTSDGLMSDEVYNLHQDKTGYIWIFTNYGTLKFNGTEFKQVLKNLPFNESFIYSIYENENGRKWIANSNAKLFEIINDSAFTVKGTESTSKILRESISEVQQLHVDDALNIYALTKHHSYKFVKGKNGYSPINLSTGNKDSITYRIYEKNNKLFRVLNYTGNDTVFCGGRDNMKLLFNTQKKTFYIKLDCSISQPRHFKHYGNDIYFSYHDKIGKITNGQITSIIPINGIVLNFVKDKNNHLWVACYNNGLYELNEKDSIINHYFERTTINDVLVDSQNGLWASSSGLGLFHCSNLSDFYFSESLPLGKSLSYIKKIEDHLYVANSLGDIFSIKNNHIHYFKKQAKGDEPQDMIKIKSGFIFCARYSIEQSGYNFNQIETNILPPVLAIKLVSHSPDSVLFLQRKRLYIMENGSFKRLINFNFRAYSCELRNGKILIAMENGIWQLNNNTLFQPYYLKETENKVFKSIIIDSLNNYWFCSTGNGLFKLDVNDKIVHFKATEELPGNIVNSVSFNRLGVLLTTNTGLYYTESLNKVKNHIVWKKIYSGSVQEALFFEDKIYLSTKNGLVILDNKKIYDKESLHFNLAGIRINSHEVNVSSMKEINYNQNNIEFIFDLISFERDKYSLKYKLTGESNDSGLVDINTIAFQKLSPGNYTLTVYPSIINGEKLQIKITFFIIPAFWQTNTFLILGSLILILFCIYIIRYFFKYLKAKEAKKTKAESLILEYKLIALKAQINPHFMSNCLTAIQHLIINNKVDLATDYIAKFGMLVRQILNFSTRSLVTVKEELEIASLNIELEQLRFEKNFLFEIKVEKGLDIQNIYIPALILNPIIENAIWHGLLPLKNKREGRLLIEAKVELNTLLLIIEDNGIGRKQNGKNLSNSRESKGIDLTEQRLNNINYMFDITTSKLVFMDLFNKNTAESGTKVIISLPINLKPLQNE